jgi:hypothetical protein
MDSSDLRNIIGDWPYEPDKLSVRKILGDDGRIKIQMRIELGLMQLNPQGRPDGATPEGFATLLQYHRDRLSTYEQRNGTTLGFELNEEECEALRSEATMYYYRYLCHFVLGEYDAVATDAAHNLDIFDLCAEFAANDADGERLEVHRTYTVMMNTRAKVLAALSDEAFDSALAHVNRGLVAIRTHFEHRETPDDFLECPEAALLMAIREEVVSKLPADPLSILREELAEAVRDERFEEAARLRDEIAKLHHEAA